MHNEIIKVTFNMYQSDLQMLEDLSDWTGLNKTLCLRAAIAGEHYLRKTAAEGTKILLEHRDGKMSALIYREAPPHTRELTAFDKRLANRGGP